MGDIACHLRRRRRRCGQVTDDAADAAGGLDGTEGMRGGAIGVCHMGQERQARKQQTGCQNDSVHCPFHTSPLRLLAGGPHATAYYSQAKGEAVRWLSC